MCLAGWLQVFSGEADESVRHEQLLLQGEVMRMLKLLDMSINHQVCVQRCDYVAAHMCASRYACKRKSHLVHVRSLKCLFRPHCAIRLVASSQQLSYAFQTCCCC